nr:immunoglobulin light chain junction region [Macaca mulatta]
NYYCQIYDDNTVLF